MAFRNNINIDRRIIFLICLNVFNPSIQYIIIRNNTKEKLILVKHNEKHKIGPYSDNCFIKNDDYRIFFTDKEFVKMELYDNNYLELKNLKIIKTFFKNISFIEIDNRV